MQGEKCERNGSSVCRVERWRTDDSEEEGSVIISKAVGEMAVVV